MTFPGHRLPVLSALLIGVVLFACLWLGAYAISPAPGSSTDHVEVVIPARSKVSDISRILAEKNIIKDDPRFSMLAVLTGTARKLRAGEYRFEPGTTPLEILDFLKQGRVLYRKVVFPEGTELSGIADILAAEGWVDRNRFLDLANDPDFVREMGIEAESLEGYLFPDTYKLSRGQQDEVSVIRMMVSNHFSVYSELSEGESGNSHGMTHHEIITLASIVEKETGVVEERGLVASVFLNRLERGMMLLFLVLRF